MIPRDSTAPLADFGVMSQWRPEAKEAYQYAICMGCLWLHWHWTLFVPRMPSIRTVLGGARFWWFVSLISTSISVTERAFSAMCLVSTLWNNRVYLQHQLRYHDAYHCHSFTLYYSPTCAAESGPPDRLWDGRFRDRRSYSHQDLLPGAKSHHLHLLELVLPRSIRLGIRHEPACSLVTSARDISAPQELGVWE